MEERELMGLRDWAAGTVEEEEADTMKEDKNTVASNSMKRVRMSTPKLSSLYPSLKALQQQEHVSTSKKVNNSSLNQEEKEWKTAPTRRRQGKKVKKEEPILRENISISRLGWNRDLSAVRKRCRTDANLKAAAFLSNQ